MYLIINNTLESGWIGRFLESYYSNFLTANFPLGIQLGSSDNSLGFMEKWSMVSQSILTDKIHQVFIL